MPTKNRRPRKSLRTLLILWFLGFSIAPLAFLTLYSLGKYQEALDLELSKRLQANSREVSVTMGQFQEILTTKSRSHANDKTLIYDLTINNINAARELVRKWLQQTDAHKIWLYNRNGRLEAAMYKDGDGEVQRKQKFESGVYSLNEAYLKKINEAPDEIPFFQLPDKGRAGDGSLALTMFLKVKSSSGQVVGYLEEVIQLGDPFLQAVKNRLNVELFFYQPGKDSIVATHEDLPLHKPETFEKQINGARTGFFEMNIRDNPYRFLLTSITWGQEKLIMGLGASKSPSRAVLRNITSAFTIVVGAIAILLIILSVIMSRILLKPIYEVLDAIEAADFDKEKLVQIPVTNNTELGLLAESFNDLSLRTFESQKKLKANVHQLEAANLEIRDTQARLVHAAKMAGLGQLVAGVAHELNNPIGFIYSNMSSLRDYSKKLLHLVHVAEEEPEKLEREVKKVDLEYIEKDLPKLISSCEDGARRTRDIVIGLRNFSRLEESQLKEVDVHDGLNSTLQLLTGELKNRITVHKDYGKLPKITCYPGELNQVFMNILSNASQAIEKEGDIFITTKMHGKDEIEVVIKDNGKGMSKDTMDKMFDPFFTTKAAGHGTGLGMSISFSVVQKHGGEIQVTSEPRKGSEFKIILPVDGPA